jgi:hypothetical protein
MAIIITSSFCIILPNLASAEVDPDDIEFLETGMLDTSKNQFHISNEITIREFFNGNIIRVSGQTIEGFPYITYSKIVDNKINTHGMIFISGQFVNLSFEEKQNQKVIDTEKKEDIVILVQYTQRVYSENFVKLEIKIFDSQQNKLNNFYQNYGYVLDTDIEIIVMDENNQEFYSSSGVTNSKGYYETEFWLPENSKRETLTVTINADNENSKSSKLLQIFNLGRIPSD